MQRGVTIITTPIFTRLLTVQEYGTYSIFNTWMGIFNCFLTLNLFSGVYPQLVIKNEDNKEDVTIQLIGVTTILLVLGSLAYAFIERTCNIEIGLEPLYLLCMFVTIWADAVFGFWSYSQRMEYRYRALTIVTIIQAILYPTFCTILVSLVSVRLNGLFLGIALSRLICYGPLVAVQLRKSHTIYSSDMWRHALLLGIGLIPHYLSGIILNSSDRIMIERFAGSSEAGLYNLAYTISMAGLLINQAILQTLNPWLLKKIKTGDFYAIGKVSYVLLVGVALFNLCILLFAPELIGVFAPESYADAVAAMPPIVMSVYFMFAYNFFSVFEFYYEKSGYISSATTAGAIINIILNLLLIPRFGFVAAGYTTLVCYAFFTCAHYCFMRQICKKELGNVKVFSLPILFAITDCFLILGFMTPFLYGVSYVKYGFIFIVFVVVFLNRNQLFSILKKYRG